MAVGLEIEGAVAGDDDRAAVVGPVRAPHVVAAAAVAWAVVALDVNILGGR